MYLYIFIILQTNIYHAVVKFLYLISKPHLPKTEKKAMFSLYVWSLGLQLVLTLDLEQYCIIWTNRCREVDFDYK